MKKINLLFVAIFSFFTIGLSRIGAAEGTFYKYSFLNSSSFLPVSPKGADSSKHGPRGHRGPHGHRGHKGKHGVGTAGANGAPGSTGPQGAAGLTGSTGATGSSAEVVSAYGHVYNFGAQTVFAGDAITFDTTGELSNVTFVSDSYIINIPGTYRVSYNVSIAVNRIENYYNPALAVQVNGVVEANTQFTYNTFLSVGLTPPLTFLYNGGNEALLSLNAGDIIQLVNTDNGARTPPIIFTASIRGTTIDAEFLIEKLN